MLIFGFIRLKSKPLIIPKELFYIIESFYDKIEIIFDVFYPEFEKFICNNGLTINTKMENNNDELPVDYISYASSIGWNKGIHIWTIYTKSDMGMGLGIVSNLKSIKNNRDHYILYTEDTDLIGYNLDGNGNIYLIKHGNFEPVVRGGPWGENTKFTMILDCDNWKLTYYFNEKIHCETINIQSGITYYAAITVWYSNITLDIVETPQEILNSLQN